MWHGLVMFWKKVRRESRTIALLWFMGLAVTVLQLVLPEQVGRLTNLFEAPARGVSWSEINRVVAWLIGSQVLIALFNYSRGRLLDRHRDRLIREASMQMYRRLIRSDAEFFRVHESETINHRVLEDVRSAVTFWFDLLLKMPLMVGSILVYGAFMFSTNWFFALCLIPLCFLSGYFLLFDRRMQAVNRASGGAWEQVRGQAKEYVGSVEEIRPNNAFGYGFGLLDRAFQVYHEAMDGVSRLRCLFNVVNPIVTTIQDGALYWIGAALCLLTLKSASLFGPVTWGDVMKFMLVAGLFKRPVGELCSVLLDWRMNSRTLDGVQEFENLPVAFPETDQPGAALRPGSGIGYRRADVVASSGTRILNQITLTIGEGEHVAFVGPAGCGKSTAIRLLFKGSQPSGGEVVLRDLQVEEVSLGTLARETGVVQQAPFLLNRTLRDNLLLSLRRPSLRTLRDQDGEIDVEPMPEVKTLEDLNQALLAVVQAVGLEADVLRKGLDSTVPLARRDCALFTQLAKVRQHLAEKLACEPANAVVRFERTTYLNQGTLRDNLLFGLRAKTPPADDAHLERTLLPGCLEQAGLLEPLVQLGLNRLRTDTRLAASLIQCTRELEELLKFAAPGRSGSPGVEGLALAGGVAKPALRSALLKAALDMDAKQAPALSGISDFETRVISARTALREQASGADGEYEDYLSTGRIEGLSLRELLLRGRVDEGVFRASERIDRMIQDCLTELGLLPDALSLGLDYRVGENGRSLSGGQKQKVAIARTLLKRPSILLLDEATSALDELSQKRIVELIRTEYRNKIVVSISHRLSTIKDCHRIFVFDRGSLVQNGTYAELAEQPGLFRLLLDRQETGALPQPDAVPVAGVAAAPPEAENLRHQLAQCTLFASLKADQIEILARVAKIVRCDPEAVLFRRGDAGDELFVVLSGQVEFFVEETLATGERKLTIEGKAGPGEAFGEIAVFSGETRTLGVRTSGESQLCVIQRETLLKILESSPAMAVSLLQTLARRITRVREERYRGRFK